MSRMGVTSNRLHSIAFILGEMGYEMTRAQIEKVIEQADIEYGRLSQQGIPSENYSQVFDRILAGQFQKPTRSPSIVITLTKQGKRV